MSSNQGHSRSKGLGESPRRTAAARSDHPLERRCTHKTERFQLTFAREAIQLLPRDESIAFETDARGLLIMAETEMALERPVRRLEEIYGDSVCLGPPTVRYRHGETVEQPIMGLRILCAAEHHEAIALDLQKRRASILDTEVNPRFGILRASAPLAALIGYPDRLARMTEGRVQLVMWLSHYAHLEHPPPPVAA